MTHSGKRKQGRTKKDNDGDTRPKLTTYKYSENGKAELYEAIILGGKPCFVNHDAEIKNVGCTEEIGEPFRILVPPQPSEYSYPPYEFADEEDLVLTYLEARKQNLDTLFSKAQSIICKYNDQDSHKLDSIASDAIWGYFQDRFATTRYELLTGGVGSGKSALAATYGAIGYRPVNTTNPTAAVIYRLLGNIEPGQCTMILEEAEKIDQIYEIMAILKTGYTRDGKVDRTNPNTLKPEFFNSYCFKIIVAERSPNQDSGKGVVDRSFIHSCFKGYPDYDIKEILNPTNTGGPEHQKLREELEDLRKLLLMYRLIHFKDEIADIDIGIIGRDKELVKPTLQLFQGTNSQNTLVKTFQTILDLKNRRKATSLRASLLEAACHLMSQKLIGDPRFADGMVQAYAREYWEIVPQYIPGKLDEKEPAKYHSEQYGTLYKGTIGKILHDDFGVESDHTREGALYTFNRHTIDRLRSQLTPRISVKSVTNVTTVTTSDEGDTLWKNNNCSETESKNSFNSENNERIEQTTPSQESSHSSQPSPEAQCKACNQLGLIHSIRLNDKGPWVNRIQYNAIHRDGKKCQWLDCEERQGLRR